MLAMGKLRWLGYTFCCFLVGATSAATSGPSLRSADNRWFEIVALDARSVGYAEALSRQVVDRAMLYMDIRQMSFPQRILVQLRPPEYVDFEGPFRLQIGDGGFITLHVRWDERMDLPTFCAALSEAFVLRYAYFNFGPSAMDRVPAWAVQTLALDVYFSLRPGLLFEAVKQAREDGAPGLTELLGQRWTSGSLEVSGFLMIERLQGAGMSRGSIRQLYEAGLSGGDVLPLITGFLGVDAVGADTWWAETLAQMEQSQMTVFERLEDSRSWVEAFAHFEVDGEVINLRQLWELREDPSVRDLVAARLELLRIRIARVNPAYFNAARSLGVLFETILERRRSHEYIGGLSKFLGDRDSGLAIERIVQDALTAP